MAGMYYQNLQSKQNEPWKKSLKIYLKNSNKNSKYFLSGIS